jgi:hypothetical protein
MYGSVFPILTFVVDIWDSESAEYDESCLVLWCCGLENSPLPPEIYGLLVMSIKLKEDVPCLLLWIHCGVPSKPISRFSALPKLLQEFVL